jgi:hypothetical protein
MKIKIRGPLPEKAIDLGIKVGEIYDAENAPGTIKDALRFKVMDEEGDVQWCTLRPKNYQKL